MITKMSVHRIGLTAKCIFSKVCAFNRVNSGSLFERKPNGLSGFTQIATIVSLERKLIEGESELERLTPHPWPWKHKKYTSLHFHLGLDETVARINENSKIIVIEGNKASGKEQLAQDLAKQFGMLYMPEVDLNELYINHRGFDYRTLNKFLPNELLHAYDEKMLYENPNSRAVYWMQRRFYSQRYMQYVDALAHLFSTGQGVILERSPWSDFVFIEALHRLGYLPTDVYDYYHRIRYKSMLNLLRPHLHIYLDVPVDKLMERIKKRNREWEVNSKLLTPQYLQIIEDQYKNRHLPEFKRHGEILMYDWTDGGDLEDIIEDIENIDFENFNPHEEKFEDWCLWSSLHWEGSRLQYANKKHEMVRSIEEIPLYDVDSMLIPQPDLEHQNEVFKNMMPNYDILPSHDPLHVGWFKAIFTFKLNYREEMEHCLRHPYY